MAIIINIYMQGEDIEAGNNLRSLSQRTSYIIDWTDQAKIAARHQPHSIPE
jgi:hypothetical protein